MFTPQDDQTQLPLMHAFSNSDPGTWGIPSPNSINHESQVPGHLNLPPTPDFNAMGDAIRSTQSPYMTMGAHGWLQDNHPGIAGMLDNGLAAVANYQQGHTTGENIASLGRSLLMARQQRREHDIEQATLPVQIAQQQLAYQGGLQKLYQSQAEIQHWQAQGDYWREQADTNKAWREGRLNQLDNRFGGQVKFDDEGHPWQPDLNNGQLHYAGPDQLPPGYQPSFTKANQHGSVGGGLWGNVATAADVPGATPQQNAQNRLALYGKTQSQIAGSKTGAVNAANDPKTRAEEFQKSEIASAVDGLGKRPTPSEQEEFQKNELMRILLDPKGTSDPSALSKIPSLDQRQKDYDAKLKDMKSRAGNYVKSGDAKRGKKFDPSQYGDTPAVAPNDSNPYR